VTIGRFLRADAWASHDPDTSTAAGRVDEALD
jgi:hypothetical protein